MLWSRIPILAVVSFTSHVPQNNTGKYSGTVCYVVQQAFRLGVQISQQLLASAAEIKNSKVESWNQPAMAGLHVQWSQMEWSQLPAMFANYPSNQREMLPLLDQALESLSHDLWQFCREDLCVLGIFALQLMAVSGMLSEGSVTRQVAQQLLETNMQAFVDCLKDSGLKLCQRVLIELRVSKYGSLSMRR